MSPKIPFSLLPNCSPNMISHPVTPLNAKPVSSCTRNTSHPMERILQGAPERGGSLHICRWVAQKPRFNCWSLCWLCHTSCSEHYELGHTILWISKQEMLSCVHKTLPPKLFLLRSDQGVMGKRALSLCIRLLASYRLCAAENEHSGVIFLNTGSSWYSNVRVIQLAVDRIRKTMTIESL